MSIIPEDTDAESIVDMRGLKCPLPALIAKRAVVRLPPGRIIWLVADDPLAEVDLTYMCERDGITVLTKVRENGVLKMSIRYAVNALGAAAGASNAP